MADAEDAACVVSPNPANDTADAINSTADIPAARQQAEEMKGSIADMPPSPLPVADVVNQEQAGLHLAQPRNPADDVVADKADERVKAVVDGVCRIAIADVICGAWRTADGVAVASTAFCARPVLVASRTASAKICSCLHKL